MAAQDVRESVLKGELDARSKQWNKTVLIVATEARNLVTDKSLALEELESVVGNLLHRAFQHR